jgi:hypothetical protein
MENPKEEELEQKRESLEKPEHTHSVESQSDTLDESNQLKKKNKEPKQKEKAEVGHSIGYLYAKGLYLAGYKKRTREEYLESLRKLDKQKKEDKK